MSQNSKITQLKTKSRLSNDTTLQRERKKTISAITTAEEHRKKPTKATATTSAINPQTQSPRTASTAAASSTRHTLTTAKGNDIRNKLGISTKPIGGDVRKKPEVTTPRTTTVKTKTTIKHPATDKSQTSIKSTAASVTAASKKVVSTASKNVKAKVCNQPLRAKHSVDIVEAIRRNAARTTTLIKSATKPNAVLDTYHNVTVTSPPPKRREHRPGPVEPEQTERRPRTRTLDAEEVVVLKSDSAKQRCEQEVMKNVVVDKQQQQQVKESVKDPVAFEVKFEKVERPDAENAMSLRAKQMDTNATETTENNESYEDAYAEDDFESYESDFETGSSTQNGSATETESSSSSISTENESEDKGQESDSAAENVVAKEINEESDCEESELTQFPVTVIQRYKDHERKLDSGSYEIRNRQVQPTESDATVPNSQEAFVESLDTLSTGASEQLDSGISNSGNSVQNTPQRVADTYNYAAFYSGFESFNTRPVNTKRGLELMSKIQFDTLTFVLLDMKPISYEVFMQTYGRLNTMQSSTQTQDQHGNVECQTDDCELRSIWTQHPPQYDLQTVQTVLASGLPGATVQNCCGEFPAEDELHEFNQQPCDPYDASLQALSKMRTIERLRSQAKELRRLRKPVDCERLNQFLLRSAFVMSHVLNANSRTSNNAQASLNAESKWNPLSSISSGYRQLDVHFLNALQVVRIFANANHSLLLTVHACRPDTDVYRSDFSHLLMVWSTTDTSGKPLRLLSSWSEICRAEICQESVNIVVCGLRDGSVAMWDLQETHSFCSKLDGHLTHFAATQSIVPSWDGERGSRELLDLGSVVDVRSFRSAHKSLGLTSGYKAVQFATLHDTGILTIWSLVETGKLHENILNHRHRPNNAKWTTSSYEFSSPWANVKLTQSAICDLHSYLQRKVLNSHSKFHQTKSLFEKNIYSDEVLRELGETLQEGEGKGLQGLRFTSIDVGSERVYVCTNHNFILSCSKSLKPERFDKITINESRFLFPTTLRVLSNEDFLAVGLSNGSVMILNCNQNVDNNEVVVKQSGEDERYKEKAVSRDTAPTSDRYPETGKSCAIQNIILNERHSLERAFADNHSVPAYETRPSTTAQYIEMINEQKKPFELRVYDQQTLLSGSVLRKSLVQALELSTDGWKLFALSDGEIRVYDFFSDRELNENVSLLPEHAEVGKVCDIAVASSGRNVQYLLLLGGDNNIQLHHLKAS